MGYWILNESVSVLLLLLWLALNLYLFVDTFCWFQKEDAYLYTRVMLGSTLAWARASAMCLNFNCMLVLLPVCRNLMSFLRGTNPCCRRTLRRQLDKNLTFHRMVGYMIGLHTIIHVVAHLVNVEKYHMGQSKDADELQFMLSCIGQNSNETYLNPIRSYNTNTLNEVFSTIAGVTGFIITVALILIMTSSTELIRRSFYEVFWYTHHLSIAFFIALIVHGAGQLVRGQTPHSLFMHNVSHCKDHYAEWGEAAQCPLPEFSGNKPAVMAHASGVLELHMKKRGFRMEPGQYVFLQCPSISQLEWHPFTLTSAPEEEYFSVHVRVAGDWTEALWKAFGAEEKVFQEPWKIPRLAVDGPFGAATTDAFHYQVSMCIAAGIGVTPFASVLKSIWYRFCNPNIQQKLEKVYFYWICRDTCHFEWFVDLLLSLEGQMAERGNAHFLSYHLFLTGWDETQAAHVALHYDDQTDALTGLRQKTFYGRPNWSREFRQIADSHPSTSIGVFFCGPKALSKTLQKMSSLHSSADPRGVCFHYNKESF